MGEFGALANQFMFAPHITPDSSVLDFGCGGGAMLKHLNCRERVGIEVNPYARRDAAARDIATKPSLDCIGAETIDIVISCHALEHVHNPWSIACEMFRVLRQGGGVPSLLCRMIVSNKRTVKLISISICTRGILCSSVIFSEVQDSSLNQWNYCNMNGSRHRFRS
ncbi:hypothetical protein COU80_04575 [Candidatus Peregrinibacteria bacterium CG10_big_fil_rev_8_21_14_0_10_55_24]|nr:MAG: hypothetical protein COU80_04575 [Candidatus Peregrinibacteria bacterium CG10_big_fil_rev_8_21_14_0_10_55_24]